MFAEECRRKGHDPDDILEKWQEDAKVLSAAKKANVSWGDEAKWADAEARALRNLQSAGE